MSPKASPVIHLQYSSQWILSIPMNPLNESVQTFRIWSSDESSMWIPPMNPLNESLPTSLNESFQSTGWFSKWVFPMNPLRWIPDYSSWRLFPMYSCRCVSTNESSQWSLWLSVNSQCKLYTLNPRSVKHLQNFQSITASSRTISKFKKQLLSTLLWFPFAFHLVSIWFPFGFSFSQREKFS